MNARTLLALGTRLALYTPLFMRTLTLILACLTPFLGAAPAYSASSPLAGCDSLLSSTELINFSTVKTFVEATTDGTVAAEPKPIADQIAKNNPEFHKRMTQVNAKGSLTEADYSRLLTQHHREFMSQFTNPLQLETLRNESLKDDLRQHGLEVKEKNGREALVKQSAKNLRRTMEREKLSTKYLEDPELAAFVSQFGLQANRYSHTDIFSGNILISSRQITRYGLPGGYQSRFDFNTKFLKSDNNVFFFLDFEYLARSTQRQSEYGNVLYKLKGGYAREHGWVSPFLMYPRELAEFAASALKKQVLLRETDRSSQENFVATPAARRALSQVHNYDFTFDDFQMLMRHRLGTILQKVKENGSYTLYQWDAWRGHSVKVAMTLQELMNSLEHGGLNSLMDEAYEPIQMELKIPVATPRTAFVRPGL